MNRRDLLAGAAATSAGLAYLNKTVSSQTKRKPMVFNVSTHAGPGGNTLYVPDRDGPNPAILLLHGSEGVWSSFMPLQALYFAMHGFVAFAFPYG